MHEPALERVVPRELTQQTSKHWEERRKSTPGSGLLPRICLFDPQRDVRAGH